MLTVTVAVPPSSAISVRSISRLSTGGGSSSAMLPRAVAPATVAAPAGDTPPSVTVKVSASASSRLSCRIGTLNVATVSPALTVALPAAAVKSSPAAAVSPASDDAAQLTTTSRFDSALRVTVKVALPSASPALASATLSVGAATVAVAALAAGASSWPASSVKVTFTLIRWPASAAWST